MHDTAREASQLGSCVGQPMVPIGNLQHRHKVDWWAVIECIEQGAHAHCDPAVARRTMIASKTAVFLVGSTARALGSCCIDGAEP